MAANDDTHGGEDEPGLRELYAGFAPIGLLAHQEREGRFGMIHAACDERRGNTLVLAQAARELADALVLEMKRR